MATGLDCVRMGQFGWNEVIWVRLDVVRLWCECSYDVNAPLLFIKDGVLLCSVWKIDDTVNGYGI